MSLIMKYNNLFVTFDSYQCVACAIGKSGKLPFSDYSLVYTSPLEIFEMDIWGPALVTSNGIVYYLSIVGVCTRFTWI